MEQHRSIGQLISIIHRSSFSYMNQEGRPLGLTHSQLVILHYILHHPINFQHNIQEHFQMDRGTVSVIIKGLEKGEFILRQPDPNDKRSISAFPTEKARNIEPMLQKILQGWTNLLLKEFSPKEQFKAFELLDRMIHNINSRVTG